VTGSPRAPCASHAAALDHAHRGRGRAALPYCGALAAAFGFVALPAPLMLAALIIVVAYVETTEGVKRRFYLG
jgi:hypothetical protein